MELKCRYVIISIVSQCSFPALITMHLITISFFKMAVTRKIEVGISSNFLHSISTSICIRKCNKNWGSFFGHFLEKSMGYSTVIFSDFGPF